MKVPNLPDATGMVVSALLGAAAAEAAAVALGGVVLPLRFLAVLTVLLLALSLLGHLAGRRLRQAWQASQRQLEAELSAEKDRFIADVSFGLRTPLTGVVGFAHMLRGAQLADAERKMVEVIVSEAAELSELVDDLLLAGRLDAGAVQPEHRSLDARHQIEQALALAGLVGFQPAVTCPDTQIVVDPELFRHVLRVLVSNAREHGRPPYEVAAGVRAGQLHCHVIDHGPGVPATLADSLFRRWTDGAGNTLGLGLGVAREVAELAGWQLSYRRVRGETHFVLSVPLAAPEAGEVSEGALVAAS